MTEYAKKTTACRRTTLMSVFSGYKKNIDIGMRCCDICDEESQLQQKFCQKQTPQSASASSLCEVQEMNKE